MQENIDEALSAFNSTKKAHRKCTRSIEKKVTMAAEIEIKPVVYIPKDEVEIERCGPPTVKKFRRCCSLKNDCKFIVEQNLTVRVPIRFHAKAEANALGMVCDTDSRYCDDYEDC